MTYDNIYNELATINDQTYFVQDGPLFDEPMVRSVDNLLEAERDNVQKMYGKEVLE